VAKQAVRPVSVPTITIRSSEPLESFQKLRVNAMSSANRGNTGRAAGSQRSGTDATKGSPSPAAGSPAADRAHKDELLEEALDESFPASDPVAISVEKPQDSA
jgi:hypothetical protein